MNLLPIRSLCMLSPKSSRRFDEGYVRLASTRGAQASKRQRVRTLSLG